MPEPADPESLVPPDKLDPAYQSPLGTYLKLNGLSATGFARGMGCDYRSVLKWIRGENAPELEYMLEIERVTKGVVAVETWAGLTQVKSRIQSIRAKQTESFQEIQNENEPGGFAKPMAYREGKRHDSDRGL